MGAATTSSASGVSGAANPTFCSSPIACLDLTEKFRIAGDGIIQRLRSTKVGYVDM
jgi:hypothetical protein